MTALTLVGWTAFQLHEDEQNTSLQWQEELQRLASDRAALLHNWLADRRDDAADLANRMLVQQLFSGDGGLLESTATRARFDQYALTYGYSGMVVLDGMGRVKARSTRLAVTPGQLNLQMSQARERCAPVLDVLPGGEGKPVFVAMAPVLPIGKTTCTPENLEGYVAVEATADQELFSRLHMDLPPPGVTVVLLRRNQDGPALLLHSARSETKAAAAPPTQLDAVLTELATPWASDYYQTSVGGREIWYAARVIPPVDWMLAAYTDRDWALQEFHHNRRLLLLFDVLLLLVVAGSLAALNLRSRTRRLQDELDRQRVIARLREYARRIVDSSPVGLVVLDAEWRAVSVNRSFCRMAGVEEADLLRQPVEACVETGQIGPLAQWPLHHIGDGLAFLRPRRGAAKPVHLILTSLVEAEGEDGRYLLTIEDLSQRRQMEERYRLLFERNMAAIVQTSLDGEILDCNDAYARMLGFQSRLELLSSPILQFYRSPADRERFLQQIRSAGNLDGFELELRRQDGEAVWALAGASLIESGDDSPPMVQTTLVDITQRKQTQQIVEKQARLLDLTRDAVIVRDLDGTIRFWNEGAHLMYGWTGAEALGQPSHALLRTESPVQRETMEAELLASDFWAGDLRQSRKDGRNVDVASQWVLQRDEAGRPQTVLETNTDMTLRRVAENALAASNRKIVEIFDSITEGFFALDNEWRFTYVNREAERMLRATSSELLGRNIWEVMPGCWGGPFHLNYERALREGVKVDFEEFSPTVGAWVEVSAYPSPSGLSIYFRDVSERRHLEARVRQAEKMDAVGRLAGGIAHDFNNLLNVIGGYSELLSQHLQDNPKLGHYAQEITASALRAGALTRQLLTFGRRQKTAPKVLNLNSVLRGLEPLLQRLMGEDIEMVMVQAPELGNVQADPSQIEQVVVNLAANARDAMPHGGRFLMETSNFEVDEPFQDEQIRLEQGRYVLLSVSDTGVGMDMSVRRRIFEPFFTTKDVGKGTGLGLSTVDGVVQQTGGAIWVYSEPGRGTTFKIYLPRVAEPLTAEPVELGQSLPVRGGVESILLVEDEEALRSLVREVLEKYGYQVVCAGNGEEALQRMGELGPFNLVLTDVVMPGMGGAELGERIHEVFPETRILFMSGYTGRAMLRQGRLRPGSHFLAKPFTGIRLARAVRECLDRATSPRVVEWLSKES